MENKGQLLVYTGEGKGKTTAALGLAVRAAGQGKRVKMIQFIKSPDRTVGERKVLQKLGIEIYPMGMGFTWTKTPEEHRTALKHAWLLSKDLLQSNDVDVLILDEINNALAVSRFPIEDIVTTKEVLEALQSRREGLHVVLTGRGAKKDILLAADLVTEMKGIKHYYDREVPAIVGLDY
ncbi:cob(I)yrinic acid a,c-diamide adenosyltransferase [Robertmurraya korlensis]|uniref:cob(I)yrinic acid a,c-diamide adenosyltransferase n=1 Tax=Robertmurraya korlensis TaxID=519977 RepID=UPI000824DE67|nr:cob(I)yrinic acid a,c-diamide adenosyltransferase [Robertmurraya korlensis]